MTSMAMAMAMAQAELVRWHLERFEPRGATPGRCQMEGAPGNLLMISSEILVEYRVDYSGF